MTFANRPILLFRAFRNNGEDVFSTKSVHQSTADLDPFGRSNLQFETSGDNRSGSNDDVVVYPNPTSEYLLIESTEFRPYRVFSEQGSLVADGQIHIGINRVYIGELSEGFYIIVVGDQHKKVTILR